MAILLWKEFELWMDPCMSNDSVSPRPSGCLGLIRLKFHLSVGEVLNFLVIMVIVANIRNHV